jgi:hypothetical protein
MCLQYHFHPLYFFLILLMADVHTSHSMDGCYLVILQDLYGHVQVGEQDTNT